MGVSHLISIVGAGPGDPELLTLKALRRLQNADVILYDALMGEEILSLAKPDTQKIYVGKLYKDGQNQKMRQEEIHALFLKYAGESRKVVRLKAGDPNIYGRGAEEVRFCKSNNLNYEVIPGITAALAGAANFDIPLTERDKSGMALFYTGHRVDGGFSDLESVVSVLKANAPVMIYMGLNNLVDLSESLIRSGIACSISVQILSKISQAEEKAYETTLGEIEVFLEEQSPNTPSIIIIGENTKRI